MAKRKNNTLSNLGKTTKPVKEETPKVLPDTEIKLTETTKPKVTRAKTKSIEKITVIETNEQNLANTDNIEEAIIVEENNTINVVIDDMIDAVKDASNAQEIKDKKSQYKHPLLQETPDTINPYENLAHLYVTLMQDMAKFQQELFSATWKMFIEQSNSIIGQYYGMLNTAIKVKK